MTSDEPGMSVSAPATRPPVQDSAVAMVNLRIRQRSSSERERARASLPLMLVAPALVVPTLVIPALVIPALVIPRQADGGARGGRDAFLAAGEAEPLAGGCLHGDARDVHARDIGDARAHRVAQRTDLRPFADQGDFEIGDAAAARGDALDRVFQELVGGGALPLHVAG